jgi:colicin import membrane protein
MTGSESSVVVSLKELMRLEGDRVAAEASLQRRREEERRAAEARDREDELAREATLRAAQAEKERLERERQREAELYLQSQRDADKERARREAELRTLAESPAADSERHWKKQAQKSRGTLLAVVVVSMIALFATALLTRVLAAGQLEEMRLSHARAVLQFTETVRNLEQRARDAEEKWKMAGDELERTKAALATVGDRPREPHRIERETHAAPATPRPRRPRCAPCPPGDPLCGCLDP